MSETNVGILLAKTQSARLMLNFEKFSNINMHEPLSQSNVASIISCVAHVLALITIASVSVCVESIAKVTAASVRPNGVRTPLTTAISIFMAFINVYIM